MLRSWKRREKVTAGRTSPKREIELHFEGFLRRAVRVIEKSVATHGPNHKVDVLLSNAVLRDLVTQLQKDIHGLQDRIPKYEKYDWNVRFFQLLSLYTAAWSSWVSLAKSYDAKRKLKDRLNYFSSHRELLDAYRRAINVGESLVLPIMRARKNQISKVEEHP